MHVYLLLVRLFHERIRRTAATAWKRLNLPSLIGVNPTRQPRRNDRAGHAEDTGLPFSPDGGAHFPIAAASVLSTGAVLLAYTIYGVVNRLSKPNIPS